MKITYDNLLSIDKILKIYYKIRLNTCHQQKLVRFELAFSSNITKILYLLKSRTYTHGQYSLFLISEPKYRIVMSERILDKIVNHLISKYVLIPYLIPKLVETNVATRSGKGTKAGIYYIKKYINKLKQNYDQIYVLKCDISKYFYNINHEILLQKLIKDIPDFEIIDVLKNIINSTDAKYINNQIDNLIVKEKEKLRQKSIPDIFCKFQELNYLPRYKKGKGLPIGNETSQILAIYYLNELDHFIKEKLQIKYYIRYMDDFILIHHNKEFLKECLVEINRKVQKLGLALNKKTQIYDLNKGINFLGYKFKLKEKKLLILLNNQTKKRVKRKLKRLKKQKKSNYKQVLASYNGYFMVANTKYFLYKNKF